MHQDLVDLARRIVRDRFPEAPAAVLAGSSAAGRATPSSDLDLAVLLGDEGRTSRETLRVEGRVVEVFAHTRAGVAELFAADVVARRGTLQTMWATGLVLVDREGEGARVRELARAQLSAGAPALDAATVETRRYALTDALDDLGDAADPVERLAVAGLVLSGAADLLADHHRAWTGAGKWLPRRLLAADPERGAALFQGHLRLCGSGDPVPLIRAALEVLDLVGGPLREGYRRDWRGVVER